MARRQPVERVDTVGTRQPRPILRVLSLSNNQLSGSIPSELGDLANLVSAVARQQPVERADTVELGNLDNLVTLWLGDNQLSGSIPPRLGNLANLYRAVPPRNQLSGSIPSELGNLDNLQASTATS